MCHVARCIVRGKDTNNFLTLVRDLLAVNPVTIEVHETGLRLAERYGMPIYDAMIAASALHAGCDTLLSEDFQHGLVLKERAPYHQSFSLSSRQPKS